MKKTTFGTIVCTFLALAFQLTVAGAHGEDKPGPHKGFIKMPGPFHTEVMQTSDHTLKIYLLDMEWKNPTIKDSSVAVSYQGKMGREQGVCQPEAGTHYTCRFSPKVKLGAAGQLIVKAVRSKQKGNDAIYDLPLSLQAPADPHAGH